ncbi:MAG: PIN domain-containing protein [Candidatus Hadarchaeum sp.]|uniref:type II toxin-antitoxin system VapC family toxin n=1 Tax=Candidatus Hadarchaeum sp. TaxID=2883567 RepID=UPI00316F1C3A
MDTSAFYALADHSDRHHEEAVATYQGLLGKAELLTRDYVLVECWFLAHHLGREAALKFWDALLAGILDLVKVELAELREARRILEEYPHQGLSLVDAANFAVLDAWGSPTSSPTTF